MTIFDFTGDILYKKKGDKLESIDDETDYIPYMVNRWISMYSPEVAVVINETVNRHWSMFANKQDHYKFLINILPVCPSKRIKYIKKAKKKTTKDLDKKVLLKLARKYEISVREVEKYIESPHFDKNALKPYLKA